METSDRIEFLVAKLTLHEQQRFVLNEGNLTGCCNILQYGLEYIQKYFPNVGMNVFVTDILIPTFYFFSFSWWHL